MLSRFAIRRRIERVLAGTTLIAQTQCATAAGVKGWATPLPPEAASTRNRGKQRASALWNRRSGLTARLCNPCGFWVRGHTTRCSCVSGHALLSMPVRAEPGLRQGKEGVAPMLPLHPGFPWTPVGVAVIASRPFVPRKPRTPHPPWERTLPPQTHRAIGHPVQRDAVINRPGNGSQTGLLSPSSQKTPDCSAHS